jgi:hypothetical protein
MRVQKEKEFQVVKSTAPLIEAFLAMDKNRIVSVGVKFLNAVPIKFTYTLEHFKGDKGLSNHMAEEFELYPPVDNKTIFIRDDFNFHDHIPNDQFSTLKVTINYESIYYVESLNPSLRGSVSATYTINPNSNTITHN